MADKFRKTIPIKISFGSGEQPTAAKLNAIADQTRAGNAIIENALGDLWNESGDAVLNTTPLQIPNLARMIGENSYYNPALVPTSTQFEYTESLGTTYLGKNTGYLRFPPEDGSIDGGASFSVTGGGTTFTTAQDYEYEVAATGDYWIEKGTGKFRIFGDIPAALKITYVVDPIANWVPGQETLPGVIPDPGQTDFTGCRVELNGSTFLLHLPPRRPLTLSDRETPYNYPPTAEIPDNEQSIPGIAAKQYWQDGVAALTGTGDEHYRYQLPKELQDATLVPQQQIPAGFLYLWDTASNTIIADVIFRWPDPAYQGFALEVESATFDFSIKVTADELEPSYSGTGLVLITSGSPISRSIWTMMSSFLQHRHDNEGTMEPSIQHKDLRDLNPPSAAATLIGEDYEGHNTRYPSYVKSWKVSNWFGDDHTSLLSRGGSQGAAPRDKFNNAMLGTLLMANADISGSESYIDNVVTDDSFSIMFGDLDGIGIRALQKYGAVIPGFRFGSGTAGDDNHTILMPHDNGSGMTLPGGSTFGTSLSGRRSGHLVMKLRPNDNSDSFSVIGDTTVGLVDAFDKLLLRVRNDGATYIGGNTIIDGTGLIDNSGTNFTTPDGSFHVFSASAGSVIADTEFDEIVLENSANSGISILSPAANKGSIGFGSPTQNDRALIEFDHSTEILTIRNGDTFGAALPVQGWIDIDESDTNAPTINLSRKTEIGVLGPINASGNPGFGGSLPQDTTFFFKVQGFDYLDRPGAVILTTQSVTLSGSFEDQIVFNFSHTRAGGMHPLVKFRLYLSSPNTTAGTWYYYDVTPNALVQQSTQLTVVDQAGQPDGTTTLAAIDLYAGPSAITTGRQHHFGDVINNNTGLIVNSHIGSNLILGGGLLTQGHGFPAIGTSTTPWYKVFTRNIQIIGGQTGATSHALFHAEDSDTDVITDKELYEWKVTTDDTQVGTNIRVADMKVHATLGYDASNTNTDIRWKLKHLTSEGNFPANEKLRLTSDGLLIQGRDLGATESLEPTSSTWPETRAYCVWMYNDSGVTLNQGEPVEPDATTAGHATSRLHVKRLVNTPALEDARRWIGIAARSIANNSWGPIAVAGIIDVTVNLIGAATSSPGDQVLPYQGGASAGFLEINNTAGRRQYSVGVVVNRDNNNKVMMRIR